MSKRIPLVLGAVVLMLAIGGGSFYGGMLYQQTRIAAIRNSFFAGRGGDNGGTGGGNGGGGNGAGGGFFGAGGGRGQFGTIKSIDGDTLTVSTPQSEVKVKLTDTTQIEKLVAGAAGDLAVGDRIIVRGQSDASGTITANNVQVTVAQTPSQ
jgi:hypothetical protein